MTLRLKREIVSKFKAGGFYGSVYSIATSLKLSKEVRVWWTSERSEFVESILRDYINGKFELKPKQKKGKK